jgi:hypothetical protein
MASIVKAPLWPLELPIMTLLMAPMAADLVAVSDQASLR